MMIYVTRWIFHAREIHLYRAAGWTVSKFPVFGHHVWIAVKLVKGWGV